jgi:hypothetical protein
VTGFAGRTHDLVYEARGPPGFPAAVANPAGPDAEIILPAGHSVARVALRAMCKNGRKTSALWEGAPCDVPEQSAKNSSNTTGSSPHTLRLLSCLPSVETARSCRHQPNSSTELAGLRHGAISLIMALPPD